MKDVLVWCMGSIVEGRGRLECRGLSVPVVLRKHVGSGEVEGDRPAVSLGMMER